MPRLLSRLTDTQIKNSSTPEKEKILSDGNGLQLRLLPNGTKSWRIVYKSPTRLKQMRITLGTYPNLTLAQTRKETVNAKELIAQGIDPQTHKKKNKSTNFYFSCTN